MEGSNGRARMPGAFGANAAGMSNLFVSSSDALPARELKQKLIGLIQARGLAYGILVRKMDFPSTASLEEMRRLFSGPQAEINPVSLPALVYRVYPDGREQLVRGLRFRGLTPRSLRDIVAAGDDSAAFEFLDNTAPFALAGGAPFVAQSCVVAPSLLIDDLELHPIQEELPKRPVVPPPPMVR
jgi:hypothetical protein